MAGFGVRIRNRSVPDGRILSENKNDWYGEYAFMIWLDFVALCRLSGYHRALPQSFVLGVSAISADRCIGDRY